MTRDARPRLLGVGVDGGEVAEGARVVGELQQRGVVGAPAALELVDELLRLKRCELCLSVSFN